MADTNTIIGSRDDLVTDVSRCLRMRYSESSCCHCVDSCPHGAVTLDGGLAINRELCRGCLLCTAVCPAGALEQHGNFDACLSQLSRVPEPVLGCPRTKACANVTMACLGGLSEEHLLALCHTVTGRLTLNLSACTDCPNSAIISPLRQRLTALSSSGLLENGCQIVIAEKVAQIDFRDESVNRRSFFASFRDSLFKSANAVLSPNDEPAERRTEYALKRLPARRKLLNRTVARLADEVKIPLLGRYEHQISFSGSCTACQGCVAICPAGALSTNTPTDHPQFDPQRCTGCGLCVEFCLDGTLELKKP